MWSRVLYKHETPNQSIKLKTLNVPCSMHFQAKWKQQTPNHCPVAMHGMIPGRCSLHSFYVSLKLCLGPNSCEVGFHLIYVAADDQLWLACLGCGEIVNFVVPVGGLWNLGQTKAPVGTIKYIIIYIYIHISVINSMLLNSHKSFPCKTLTTSFKCHSRQVQNQRLLPNAKRSSWEHGLPCAPRPTRRKACPRSLVVGLGPGGLGF